MSGDRIVACSLCEVKRAHQRTVTIDGQPVTVVECMRCDRAKCHRCGHSLAGRATACDSCGAFVNR